MIDLLKCKHFKGQNGQGYPKTNRIKCPSTSNDWQPGTAELEGHHVDALLNTCLSLSYEALQGGVKQIGLWFALLSQPIPVA